jgi:hypothetical protein
MHLIQTPPEFEEVNLAFGDPTRTLLTRGVKAEIDVVWHGQPGAHWHPLPGNTCRPGSYSMEMVDRGDGPDDDSSTRVVFDTEMSQLRWQLVNTSDAAAEGRRIAALFGVPGVMVARLEEPLRPTNDSLAAEALHNLNEQVAAIYQASRDFEAAAQDRPEAVLMNRGDYEELRRSVLRDEALEGLTRYGRAGDRPFESILGMDIVADANVPPGQIVVVGRDLLRNIQQHFTQVMEGLLGFGSALRDVGEAAQGLFQQAPSRWGIMSPNEIREREGLPPIPPRNNVLPEQDVVDEIDRLVNEQVAPGPRDDYRVNRYPKCAKCHHDWHGILCDNCDCLGELEDPV